MLSILRFALRASRLRRRGRGSPETVARLQQRRLRKLVHFAAKHSPFYREKYRGLDLDRVPLSELPTVRKDELMADFDRVVTDPHVRREDVERFIEDTGNLGREFLGRYTISHTSGSQGRPLLLVQDRPVVELFFALQAARANVFSGLGLLGGARRLLEPARLAVVTIRPGFFPSASAFSSLPPAARPFLRLLQLAASDPDLAGRLNDFRPHAIIAYAGVLEAMALRSDEFRLAPHLRQLVNNSEKMTDRTRARVTEAFGVPVLDNYASGECPFLSAGCPAGPGAHVNADWAILEVVDDEYRPVPPGRLGTKVLLTNLANETQPFIRYEIGDRLTMAPDGPCACGSRLPRIASIEGRAMEDFWVPDGSSYLRLNGGVLQAACDYLHGVREWQAVHRERDRIEFRVEPLPDTRPDAGRMREVLRERLAFFGLPPEVEVDLTVVPKLERDSRTGKFRRLVNHAGPPAARQADEALEAQPAGA
jgi:phenylacetate-coenzyme A ligase PaaK-like adenylate-forming protein